MVTSMDPRILLLELALLSTFAKGVYGEPSPFSYNQNITFHQNNFVLGRYTRNVLSNGTILQPYEDSQAEGPLKSELELLEKQHIPYSIAQPSIIAEEFIDDEASEEQDEEKEEPAFAGKTMQIDDEVATTGGFDADGINVRLSFFVVLEDGVEQHISPEDKSVVVVKLPLTATKEDIIETLKRSVPINKFYISWGNIEFINISKGTNLINDYMTLQSLMSEIEQEKKEVELNIILFPTKKWYTALNYVICKHDVIDARKSMEKLKREIQKELVAYAEGQSFEIKSLLKEFQVTAESLVMLRDAIIPLMPKTEAYKFYKMINRQISNLLKQQISIEERLSLLHFMRHKYVYH